MASRILSLSSLIGQSPYLYDGINIVLQAGQLIMNGNKVGGGVW